MIELFSIGFIFLIIGILLRVILGFDNRLANLFTIISGILTIIGFLLISTIDPFLRLVALIASMITIFVGVVTYEKKERPMIVIKKRETSGLWDGLLKDFGRKEERGQI